MKSLFTTLIWLCFLLWSGYFIAFIAGFYYPSNRDIGFAILMTAFGFLKYAIERNGETDA